MPSLLLLDLRTRYADGYYYLPSAASDSLAYHRARWPEGRWVLLEVREEPGRSPEETRLPPVLDERVRLQPSGSTR